MEQPSREADPGGHSGPHDAAGTTELLARWYGGDHGSLDRLLAIHLPWIRKRVRARLGDELRRKVESGDLVQDALMRFLKDGPRLSVNSAESFCRLMTRIVENVIRDKSDWFSARRRALSREQGVPEDYVISLDGDGPGTSVGNEEMKHLVRLALELLDPLDRRIVMRRKWDGAAFAVIGEEIGISEAAAGMRCTRALLKLSSLVERIKTRRLDELLADYDEVPEPDQEFPE